MSDIPDAPPTDQVMSEANPVEGQEAVVAQQFELTLLLPTQSFVELPQSNAAKAFDSQGFLELPLPVGFTDPIHELKQLIVESPEGFWLGSFGLAPVYAEEESRQGDDQIVWGPWKSVEVPTTNAQSQELKAENVWRLTREGVLGEYADLQAVFGEGDWQGKRRGLKVLPTAFTPITTSQHVLRLRDTLYSLVPTAPPSAAYDPAAIAVRAGTSLYTTLRGQVATQDVATEETPQEESQAVTKSKGKKQQKPAEVKAIQKSEPKTHAFSDWHFDHIEPYTYLKSLQSDLPSKATPCLKTFGVSPWSPPPHARRLRGDIVYLSTVTLEGDAYEIVGSTYGFFVANSNSGKFDPSPRKTLPKGVASSPYHSLFELLAALSPQFAANLAAILKAQNPPHVTPDIFATIQISHATPAASHVVPRPQPTADPFRSQLAYLLTGAITGDQLPPARDWNEEFTQSKEMPKGSLAERLVRERCKQRVQADFVSAATKGALVVARGDIPPLNPNEPAEAHTFLHNNMLFTRAEDQLDSYTHLGGREAARLIAAKDIAGLTLLERIDVDSLNTMPTVVVDYLGERWVVQSLIPGLFKTKEGDEEENAVYPEGDENAKKAAEEAKAADKPFPSEMTPNKDDYPPNGSFRIVYGGPSPDTPEEKVRASAYFHQLAKKVADELHLAEHSVTSHDGTKVDLHTSVDVHGVAAPDGRSYMIDLYRFHCTDVEFLENDLSDSYPHRLVLLRSELVEAYRESKLREWIEEQVRAARKQDEAEKKDESEQKENKVEGEIAADKEPVEEKKQTTVIDASKFRLDFNPDAFADRKPLADGSVIDAFSSESESSKNVRDAAKYLRDVAIPTFVADYLAGYVSATDGLQITKILHRRGINMRYLGTILDIAQNKRETLKLRGEPSKNEVDSNLASLTSLIEHEMVVRAAKHVLNKSLRQSHAFDHAALISRFFNCLLAPQTNPTANVEDLPNGICSSREWTSLSVESIRKTLSDEVAARYRHTLSADFFDKTVVPRKLFRELAVRTGVQFDLREYRFDESTPRPSVNGHSTTTDEESTTQQPASSSSNANKKKKKKAASVPATNGHVAQSSLFSPDDVINIVPVVKAATQRSPLADENYQSGHRAMVEGQTDIGQEVITDALGIYEQVFGTVHPEAALRYHSLGVVYNQLGSAALRKLNLHNSAEEALREVKPEQRAASLENLKQILLPDADAVRAEADNYFQNAVRVIRQSAIISERVHGIDSFETISQYTDLSVLEHQIGNTEMALRLNFHVVNLLAATYGPTHPNIVGMLTSAASMVQTLPDFGIVASLPLLEEALKAAKVTFGEQSSQYASVENSIGQAHGVLNNWDESLKHLDASVKIYTNVLGAEAKDTVEAQSLYKIVQDAQAREGQEQRARDERLRRKFPRVMQLRDSRRLTAPNVLSSPSQPQSNGASSTQKEHGQKADLSVDELVSFIQGTPLQTTSSSSKARKRKGSPDQAPSSQAKA